MTINWYPEKRGELNKALDEFLKKEQIKHYKTSEVHGIIVPHAGYKYSGQIAGKAYAQIKGAKRAIILSPSHYFPLNGVVSHNQEFWETPLGKVKVIDSDFRKAKLKEEHAIDNQIPFLQKLGIEEVLPLAIGNINQEKALELAKKIKDFKGVIIVSSDLSHFHPDNEANILDKRTIKAIESLDLNRLNEIDACGSFPILVLMNLCKIKNWKPRLLEYQNSGDITGDTDSVVGYASFSF
jgi:AmmeMemoRadiSam system protein B